MSPGYYLVGILLFQICYVFDLEVIYIIKEVSTNHMSKMLKNLPQLRVQLYNEGFLHRFSCENCWCNTNMYISTSLYG